ncbi:MAG: hypothetical protein J1E06_06195 [Acutalibacter sp.]|nr:hypothetical protein [Acutalibacter sp.]
MRKSPKHRKKTSRLPLYLLLAVVVTSLATTGTLAKYRSEFGAIVDMKVAAFAGGGTLDFDLDVDLGGMYPGESCTTVFTVQNYDGEKSCAVAMDYEIQVETQGNLPLEFTLTGTRDSSGENNVLAGNLVESADPVEGDPEEGTPAGGKKYLASGGKLPIASEANGQVQHKYELNIVWPLEKNDSKYERGVDKITVTVTAVQARPDAGQPGGQSGGESSGGTESQGPEPEEIE